MTRLTRKLIFVAVWSVIVTSLPAGEPERQTVKAASIGQPVRVLVWPETIHLNGPRAMRQILVTGRYRDGTERDLTNVCELRADSLDIVKVSAGGLLRPQKTGA